MPEQLTENQLDDLMAELMFAEDIHRGNTGAAGKYGSAVIAIADLRERLASRDAEVAELTAIEQRLTDHIVQLAAERDALLAESVEWSAQYQRLAEGVSDGQQ